VEQAAKDSREFMPKAGNGGNWLMLHDGQFKYIRRICKTGEEELFDTRNDPDELRNLAAKPEHRTTLLRLRQQLDEEMRQRLDGQALMNAIAGATPAL
jgi:arylsulfatase A-like enzyme